VCFDTEFQRRKKMKKNNPETETDSSSDLSCFVAQTGALVRKWKMYTRMTLLLISIG
jgi:hypothetical protein